MRQPTRRSSSSRAISASGSGVSIGRLGSAATSSRCCCLRPTSTAPTSSPSACAARLTAASAMPRCRVTICFGVASHPCHGGDSATLMRSAERAMLAAKQFGRDRSVVYSADVPAMLGVTGAPGDLQLATVIALAEALDIRDTGTAKHSHMVGRYAELMAIELELESAHVERVRLAGVLHDVGKIGVSGRGSVEARAAERRRVGRDEDAPGDRCPPVLTAGVRRRARLDPRPPRAARRERLSIRPGARQIPLEARILAVADAFEAMTADRVYRPAIGARGGARGAPGGRGHAVRRGGGGSVPARTRPRRGRYGASSGANAASRGQLTARRSAARDAGCVDRRNSGFSEADW